MCCSGIPPPPAAEAGAKRCCTITRACTITCRLRKSLRPPTERLLGRLPALCPVTIASAPRPAGRLPLSLSLTPLLWGGRLSGSAPRYSTAFSRVLEPSPPRGHRERGSPRESTVGFAKADVVWPPGLTQGPTWLLEWALCLSTRVCPLSVLGTPQHIR